MIVLFYKTKEMMKRKKYRKSDRNELSIYQPIKIAEFIPKGIDNINHTKKMKQNAG